jgi:hypothetical protein
VIHTHAVTHKARPKQQAMLQRIKVLDQAPIAVVGVAVTAAVQLLAPAFVVRAPDTAQHVPQMQSHVLN